VWALKPLELKSGLKNVSGLNSWSAASYRDRERVEERIEGEKKQK